jgi:hypothetical protein
MEKAQRYGMIKNIRLRHGKNKIMLEIDPG